MLTIENPAVVEHLEVVAVDGQQLAVALRVAYRSSEDDFLQTHNSPLYILRPQQVDELIEALAEALQLPDAIGDAALTQ